MDLWSIGGGSAASRSAKFGVVVFKASLLKWGGQSVIDPCYTITPSLYQLTIDPWYTITPSLPINHRHLLHCYTPWVCTSICAWCYMWNLCGVVVFYGSMVNWRRGWGQSTIDLSYTITPHKSAHGMCAWCYMCNECGVVVFNGSMVNWRG